MTEIISPNIEIDRLQVAGLMIGQVVTLFSDRRPDEYDRLQHIIRGTYPTVDILEWGGALAIGRPVVLLGACSMEAYRDAGSNRLPEDLVPGAIVTGMNYLLLSPDKKRIVSNRIVDKMTVSPHKVELRAATKALLDIK